VDRGRTAIETPLTTEAQRTQRGEAKEEEEKRQRTPMDCSDNKITHMRIGLKDKCHLRSAAMRMRESIGPALVEALQPKGPKRMIPGRVETIPGGIHWWHGDIGQRIVESFFLAGMPGLFAWLARRRPEIAVWFLLAAGVGAVLSAILLSMRLHVYVTEGHIRIEWRCLIRHTRREVRAKADDIVLTRIGRDKRGQIVYFVSVGGKRLSFTAPKDRVEPLQTLFREVLSGHCLPSSNDGTSGEPEGRPPFAGVSSHSVL
jgi:hypothetical protein